MLKHILKTASFAKKFIDPTEFDSNIYVDSIKKLIVITKLRASKMCQRSITFKQFEKLKPKNILKILIRFRDFELAVGMAETLNQKHFLCSIYQDWITAVLKHSSRPDSELIEKFEAKIENLAEKIDPVNFQRASFEAQ